MTEFQRVKAELKKRRNNIKHFNKAFLEAFKNARAKIRYNEKHNIDDSYKSDNGITLWHSCDEIYNSKFYQENGPAYCSFLEVAYQMGYMN